MKGHQKCRKWEPMASSLTDGKDTVCYYFVKHAESWKSSFRHPLSSAPCLCILEHIFVTCCLHSPSDFSQFVYPMSDFISSPRFKYLRATVWARFFPQICFRTENMFRALNNDGTLMSPLLTLTPPFPNAVWVSWTILTFSQFFLAHSSPTTNQRVSSAFKGVSDPMMSYPLTSMLQRPTWQLPAASLMKANGSSSASPQ